MVYFITESAREPPVVLESKPLDIPADFESRRVIEEKIIEALKEESVSTIAIYGVGGVGKTRMARRIGEKVKRDKLFEVVVMVTLGPGPNLQRISYEISDYMDVHVRSQGDNVVALVTNEYLFGFLSRRVLIILDDVWESLELQEDGVPWQKLMRSWKIMITSRFEGVCSAMEADRIFMVRGLTKEEAWILLRVEIGKSIEFSNLYPLARFVSETYRWFPGHLVAVARKLKALSTLWPRINSQKIVNLASVYGRVQPSKMLDQTSFYEKQAVTLTLVSLPETQGQAQPRTKRMWLRQEFAIAKIWPETWSPGEMTLLGSLKYLFEGSQLEMGNPFTCKLIRHGLPFSSSVLGGMIMGRMLSQEDLAQEWKRSRSLSTTKGRYKSKQEIGLNPPRSCRSELGEKHGNEDDSATQLSTKTNGNEGQKEQKSQESKLKTSSDNVLQGQRLENLVSFCSVFPSDYVFTRDVLAWQWIATGLVESEQDETMEEVCNQCFDTLLNSDEIVPCGYDYHFDQMKYKFGDSLKARLQKQHLEPKFKKYLDDERANLTEVEHLSLAVKDTDHIKFDILKQCSRLNTLIVHCCYDKLKRLPDDLFLDLKTLRNLNLSGTGIVELPRSIENLTGLKFLDVSETPIMRLPESLETFGNLLMLKLDGCLSLTNLPKSMNKLTSLCHLVLDVARQLESMPIGFGKLVNLHTLQAFLVGENEGYRIGELKDMNKLRGSLSILNLENVMSKEEAREACLSRKVGLEKIELQWSDLHDEKNPDEEGILQSLEPPFSIQELKIFFYSGGVLPTWVSNPSFWTMVSITFYRCRYLSSLPSLGELPSLKVLNIVKNNGVEEINSVFCREEVNHNHVAFTKLEKLSFVSMTRLKSWIEVKNGDFPLLQHLAIKYCPEFVGLPILSYMKSLRHMEIRSCPLLSCLPEDGLAPKLDCLMINDCPKFKKQFGNKQCEDWSKVAHVPSLYFDNQKVEDILDGEAI